jgi:uncharacterized protein involved in tolerance to divalent cations
MIKSMIVRWAGYVACMEIRGIHKVFWWGSQKEREQEYNLDLDKKIILKLILEKQEAVLYWIYLIQDREK